MPDGFKETKAFTMRNGLLYIDGRQATTDQANAFEKKYPGRLAANQKGVPWEPPDSDEPEYVEGFEEEIDPSEGTAWPPPSRFHFSLGSDRAWGFLAIALMVVAAVIAIPFCPTPNHVLGVVGLVGVVCFFGLLTVAER